MVDDVITVIIPTSGRRDPTAAITSAVSQTVATEVIVVAPVDALGDVRTLIRDVAPRVARAIAVPRGASGGRARSEGTQAATGGWIAYLDDDDVWAERKLEKQLELARELRLDVTSCRVVWRSAGSERVTAPTPRRCIRPGDRLCDYLFLDRALSVSRNAMMTSTLLVRAELAKAVDWDHAISRHQDWDFLLRIEDHLLERRGAARLAHHPSPLATITTGSEHSISSGDSWSDSLRWFDDREQYFTRRAAADFLVSQVGRYALMSRDLRGVREIVRRTSLSTPPSARALALGASGMLPRSAFERLLYLGTADDPTTVG